MKRSVLLALAFFVLFLASAGGHANNFLESNIEVEEIDISEESNETLPVSTFISMDIFNSVIHVSHLIFHSDLIFEFTLPEITETKVHAVVDTALNFTNFYKTLFRRIISPNAP